MAKRSKLPPLLNDPITAEVRDQIRITVFPEDEGQPAVDKVRLDLTQIEGKTTTLYMTPCEALEIGQALIGAVQMYLYNQKEYRDTILEPRLEESAKRKKRKKCVRQGLRPGSGGGL